MIKMIRVPIIIRADKVINDNEIVFNLERIADGLETTEYQFKLDKDIAIGLREGQSIEAYANISIKQFQARSGFRNLIDISICDHPEDNGHYDFQGSSMKPLTEKSLMELLNKLRGPISSRVLHLSGQSNGHDLISLYEKGGLDGIYLNDLNNFTESLDRGAYFEEVLFRTEKEMTASLSFAEGFINKSQSQHLLIKDRASIDRVLNETYDLFNLNKPSKGMRFA